MKLELDKVIFINLCFRILLVAHLLKEDGPERSTGAKPYRHWLDPVSERVFLICVNGLGGDFLKENSTPFLKEAAEGKGVFGLVSTGYLETNYGGLQTILTGSTSQSFPYSWLAPKCRDSILDYVGCKCGVGNVPREFPLKCRFPEKRPLENFFKFPVISEKPQNRKSCLYLISFDLDPVLTKDYRSRLRQIDEDVRFFAEVIDGLFGEKKSTFVVTSARGAPVGRSLSVQAPLVAWGKGIASSSGGVARLRHNDLAAMLSALLGVNFPTGLHGIIPMHLMDLHEYYEFELTLYTIRHFEVVLEVADVRDHFVESSELELSQLLTRLNHILLSIKKSKLSLWIFDSFLLVFLLGLSTVNLLTHSLSGFAHVFCHLKSLFLLLVVVGITVTWDPPERTLIVIFELLVFSTVQNGRQVCLEFHRSAPIFFSAHGLAFAAVTFVGVVGNGIAIPLLFAPVILLPLFNESYRRINPFVLCTRLLSGLALSALPLSRTFGESRDAFVVSSTSLLFLSDYYMLVSIFEGGLDLHAKAGFLLASATTAHLACLPRYDSLLTRDAISCALLSSSLLSACFASGTLLERLMKIYLSLFVPVLMLSLGTECIFYLAVVFHAFTWLFVEYHGTNLMELRYRPGIFSVPAVKCSSGTRFSSEDGRQVVFFLIYCYVSYFAVGHHPDLHSYDLYVIPTFFYEYPSLVSYFLAGLKFVLPFFVATTSFLTLCSLRKKDFEPLITTSVWLSDVIGCFLIFYSRFVNGLLQRSFFPAKFSYFVIQQCATVSVILSYFLGKYLLFESGKHAEGG